MSRHQGPDEVRAEHVRVLGPELGPIYHALWNECAWLHLKWDQYVELFGVKPERVDILNRSAGLFFRVVQDSLWRDILLHLTAVTDPSQTGKKDNLTIQALPPLVSDPDFRQELLVAVNKACSATEFARDWRNRRIAHRDLALAVNEGAKPLKPASRVHVREAIDAISEVVKVISGHYFNADIIFGGLQPPGNAVALLYVLRDGLEAENLSRERLRAGKPNPEDVFPPTEL